MTNPEAHPDPTKRYVAAVAVRSLVCPVWHFRRDSRQPVRGVSSGVSSHDCGIGPSGAIASSLAGAMNDPKSRDAALVAFLCTAANFSLLGIGAPFWGLVAGIAVNAVLRYREPVIEATTPDKVENRDKSAAGKLHCALICVNFPERQISPTGDSSLLMGSRSTRSCMACHLGTLRSIGTRLSSNAIR